MYVSTFPLKLTKNILEKAFKASGPALKFQALSAKPQSTSMFKRRQ